MFAILMLFLRIFADAQIRNHQRSEEEQMKFNTKTNKSLMLGMVLLALCGSLLAGCSGKNDDANSTGNGAAKTGTPASNGSKQTD